MVETHWEELAGEQLRYGDRSWELTGDVELKGSGEQIALRARRADSVTHDDASLTFDLQNPPASPNPGNLETAFASLERDDDRHVLAVRIEPRTYRYVLERMEYE